MPWDPKSYMSFGATLRERFESVNAAGFGVGGAKSDNYVIQRLQFHADVHFDEHWQLFLQFEDDRAFGKNVTTTVDQDPLDVRLGFLAYVNATEAGTFKARVGRQDFDFDLQRFVSSRDGPNVRQSFDAVWGDWESGPWRFIGFLSQPVQYDLQHPFDDTSNSHFRFHTLRIERQVLGTNELSAYYSFYQKDNARYLDASGDEKRNVFDVRFAGNLNHVDWDLEAMGQTGVVGGKDIRAWAVGARSYVNLFHVKPSLTVKPAANLSVMGALGFQWRETTADAIYVQPNIPVAGTAGKGSAWSGAYGQLRVDYRFNANLTGALEAVHYKIGNTIRQAGGHDSDYVGVELKYAL